MIASIWMCLEVLTGFNPSINGLSAPTLLPLGMELAWIIRLRAEMNFGEKYNLLPYTCLYLKQHKKSLSFLFLHCLAHSRRLGKVWGSKEIGNLLLHKLKNKIILEKLF